MRYFCTLFDRNYVDRGVSLYRSLERHAGEFKLHVLCLDDATHRALGALALPRIELLGIDELQVCDPQLARARGNRGTLEFYFTCKPVLLGHVLEREPQAARVEYLDSDLWFFSDPSNAEPAYASSSVALSPHRFDAANTWRSRYGAFNAGWVSVSAVAEGRRFVSWWRERCLESCTLVEDGEVFGDQKYLDKVLALFPSAISVEHPGVNLAPWNLGGARIERTAHGVQVNGRVLVFFHFHGTRRMRFGLHDSGLHHYRVTLTPAIREAIYRPYICELVASRRHLAQLPAPMRAGLVARRAAGPAREFALTLSAVLRRTAVASF